MKGFKHFFPVPPINTPELTIRGIGVQEHMPSCIIDRPHGTRIADYLFMLFYDPVVVGVGEKIISQPAETMMIWRPGCAQYYGNRERPYNHSWMHCNGTIIRSLLRQTRLPLNQPFRLSDPAVVERGLLAVHGELTSHARPDGRIVRNLVENFLREIARLANRPLQAPGECPASLLRARHYIESEYAAPITLEQLARMAHLSIPQFCLLFRRHFKTSPIAHLICQRMHRAACLLHDQNLKVSDVARQTGYEDLFYFSKLFKKHYGASPRALRQMAWGNRSEHSPIHQTPRPTTRPARNRGAR